MASEAMVVQHLMPYDGEAADIEQYPEERPRQDALNAGRGRDGAVDGA